MGNTYIPQMQPNKSPIQGNKKRNGVAIAGLIFGIVSVLLSCLGLTVVIGIGGLILSAFGLKSQRKGLAIGGLITSILGIILSVIMFIIIVNSSDTTSTDPSSSDAVSSQIVSSQTAQERKNSSSDNSLSSEVTSELLSSEQQSLPIDSKSEYKEKCVEYTYKEIARNPSDYKGKLAKITGEVQQVQESGKNVVLLVNITQNEYGFWEDIIWVDYKRRENESRILEDDIITLYGPIEGLKSYTTILGTDNSVPYLTARYIDIEE